MNRHIVARVCTSSNTFRIEQDRNLFEFLVDDKMFLRAQNINEIHRFISKFLPQYISDELRMKEIIRVA